MRIPLARGVNNEFYIDDSYIHRQNVRIMKVYVENISLPVSKYKMKGPRRIIMIDPIPEEYNVYAAIQNIVIGNAIIPHKR